MTISILPGVTVVVLLLFARLGGLVMLMPGLGEQLVPTRIRLALALMLTVIFFPLESVKFKGDYINDLPLLARVFGGELLVGIGLGLLARFLVAAAQVGGTIIGSQLGLSFATSVDPAMGQQDVTISTFINISMMTLIFMTDIHHLAIAGIAGSYELFVPGGAVPVGDMAQTATNMVAQLFSVALKISAPFIIFGSIMNLALGLLSRLMPQMQVYFVLNPAVIMIGLVLFAFLIQSILTVDLDFVGHGLDALKAH